MAMSGGTAKLVHTGKPSGWSGSINLYVYYKTSQDINKNRSTITCGMYVTTPSGWPIGAWTDFDGSYVGKSSLTFSGGIPSGTQGTKWLVENKSFNVEHNDDGTGEATISWQWGVNSPWGGFANSPSGSFKITLPTIPRSSSISSAGNITLGNACSIKWTPATTSYKYKIKFVLGEWDYTTDYISPATTSAYTYTGYTIYGTVERNGTTIYKELPGSATGTMTATLTTYNSSGTQIGSSSSKTFTVTIPAGIVPSLGTVSLDPSNITTTDNVSRNILVKGKNTITVSVSGAQAGAGSSIKSYTYNVLSGSTIIATTTTTSTSASFGPFQQTGVLKFRVTVTDNRSRSTSNSGSEPTWTCHDYSTPYFSSFNAYRSDSEGNADMNGTFLKCDYSIGYAAVNSTNGWAATVYYNGKPATSIDDPIDLNGDKATTYKVYAVVADKYSGTGTSSTITVFGQSRILNVTADGTGFAIGKMAESSNLFECRWAAKFNDALTVSDNGGPIINGYSVGTLGVGKQIQANSDLDDYITPGIYYSSSGADSATFTNTPYTSTGFNMTVEYLGHANYIKQTISIRAASCTQFARYRNASAVWSAWQKFSGSDDGSYLPLSGGTLTGKLTLPTNLYYASNDTAGLDCSNSDIINANGIYFKDAVDSAGEGINFYRGSGTWDRLYSYNGTLYYIPDFGTNANHDNATKHKVYHSGIACTQLYSGTLTSGSTTFNYGNYKAYVIIGQAATNMARVSIYVPKSVLTATATRYQIADETYYCSFNLSYSGSTVTLSYYGSNGSGRILYVYGIN